MHRGQAPDGVTGEGGRRGLALALATCTALRVRVLDGVGVRRGNTYFLRNSLTSGTADAVFAYGNPTDTAFTGHWNADGLNTLGVRRDAAAAPGPVPPGRPADVFCADFATQARAQEWFNGYYPAYGDVANLGADGNLRACESLP